MSLNARGLRFLRALAFTTAIAPCAWYAINGADTKEEADQVGVLAVVIPLLVLLLALLHAAARDEDESSFGGESRSFVLDRLTLLGLGASLSLLLLFPAPFRWEAPRFLIFGDLCLALFSFRRGIRLLLLSNAGLASIMVVILGAPPAAVLLPFGLGLTGAIACAQARDLHRRHNHFDLHLQLFLPAALFVALFAVCWALCDRLIPDWRPLIAAPGARPRPAKPMSFTLLFSGLVGLGILWFLIRRRIRRAEKGEGEPEDEPQLEELSAEDQVSARGVVRLYLGWLARLRALGLGRRLAESPRDLKRRLSQGRAESVSDLDEITELFERARYDSGEEMGPDEAGRAAAAVLRLQNFETPADPPDSKEGDS